MGRRQLVCEFTKLHIIAQQPGAVMLSSDATGMDPTYLRSIGGYNCDVIFCVFVIMTFNRLDIN